MAESLFKRLDVDSNSQVSLHEFAALYGTELAPGPAPTESEKRSSIEEVVEHFDVQTAENIKEIFRNADANGDGCISEQELKDLFREIDEGWSEEEFETLFKEVDKNGDGKIQHQEFVD